MAQADPITLAFGLSTAAAAANAAADAFISAEAAINLANEAVKNGGIRSDARYTVMGLVSKAHAATVAAAAAAAPATGDNMLAVMTRNSVVKARKYAQAAEFAARRVSAYANGDHAVLGWPQGAGREVAISTLKKLRENPPKLLPSLLGETGDIYDTHAERLQAHEVKLKKIEREAFTVNFCWAAPQAAVTAAQERKTIVLDEIYARRDEHIKNLPIDYVI